MNGPLARIRDPHRVQPSPLCIMRWIELAWDRRIAPVSRFDTPALTPHHRAPAGPSETASA